MRDNLIKTNFTAGEVSPRLMGRVDIMRYANGVKAIQNGVVVVEGGVMRRPGTRFAAAAKYRDRPARLIPYVFNRSQAYVLEFGDGYLRVYQNGKPVVNADNTPYEIASPYSADRLPSVNYVQGAGTIFLVHPAVKPYRLQRRGQTDWVLEPAPFIVEPFDEIRETPKKWCKPSAKEFVGSEVTLTLSDADPGENKIRHSMVRDGLPRMWVPMCASMRPCPDPAHQQCAGGCGDASLGFKRQTGRVTRLMDARGVGLDG